MIRCCFYTVATCALKLKASLIGLCLNYLKFIAKQINLMRMEYFTAFYYPPAPFNLCHYGLVLLFIFNYLRTISFHVIIKSTI